eukprot:TRINITY_DN2411_c0_g1_i5.p1 TRINITY_DN2411_c0_g1~~TRINITY_DN2411_c0_g1_i5.p1  ORF type:complete len:377 (-),score=34.24 TRINITY_DN2411_c0_g1_i5:34-1164(-)
MMQLQFTGVLCVASIVVHVLGSRSVFDASVNDFRAPSVDADSLLAQARSHIENDPGISEASIQHEIRSASGKDKKRMKKLEKSLSSATEDELVQSCQGVRNVFKKQLRKIASEIVAGKHDNLVNSLEEDSLTNVRKTGWMYRIRRARTKMFYPWKVFKRVLNASQVVSFIKRFQSKLSSTMHRCVKRIGKSRSSSQKPARSSLLAVRSLLSTSSRKRRSGRDRPEMKGKNAKILQNAGSKFDGSSRKKKSSPKKVENDHNSVIPARILQPLISRKWAFLLFCMFVDLVGLVTSIGWLMPPAGPVIRWIWFPVSAFMLEECFGGSRRLVVFNVIEELLPGLRVIPTWFIAWFGSYTDSAPSRYFRHQLHLPDRTSAS